MHSFTRAAVLIGSAFAIIAAPLAAQQRGSRETGRASANINRSGKSGGNVNRNANAYNAGNRNPNNANRNYNNANRNNNRNYNNNYNNGYYNRPGQRPDVVVVNGGGYNGNGYYNNNDDDDFLEFVGKTAAVTAGVSAVAAVIGSVSKEKPRGNNCQQQMANGQTYMVCDGVWYASVPQGYQVVAPPQGAQPQGAPPPR